MTQETPKAYFDQMMDKAATATLLHKQSATKDDTRSSPKGYVYKLGSGGEAMVEPASGGKYRVRLYSGRCAC